MQMRGYLDLSLGICSERPSTKVSLSCASLQKAEGQDLSANPNSLRTPLGEVGGDRRWPLKVVLFTWLSVSLAQGYIQSMRGRVGNYWLSLGKAWHCFPGQMDLKNPSSCVNGISSGVPGNMHALAILSLLLALKAFSSSAAACKSTEQRHEMLWKSNDCWPRAEGDGTVHPFLVPLHQGLLSSSLRVQPGSCISLELLKIQRKGTKEVVKEQFGFLTSFLGLGLSLLSPSTADKKILPNTVFWPCIPFDPSWALLKGHGSKGPAFLFLHLTQSPEHARNSIPLHKEVQRLLFPVFTLPTEDF